MSQQKPIILFPGVEILPNLTMERVKEHLKKYCAIDTLGNTIYIKKMGNDKTTFAIEFESDEIYKVRKINDGDGNRLKQVIFEMDGCEVSDYNDSDYEQL